MSSNYKDDWINILDTGQSNITWAFRDYQTPNYIFHEDYNREKIKEEILNSHRIKDAIEKRNEESGCGINIAVKEASVIIDEISHTFTLKAIRLLAVFLMKIFKQLFEQVRVNRDGVEMFREISKLTPIVLVPTHSSYFDFLLASAICFALDLPIPAIAAGQDFLHVAVVNHLLRSAGAFYMRRSFASDSFYRSIFTEYVQKILSSGERPIEFFPEGTRSRCGKALQPKLGLLAMILESFFHGFVQDVSFIPMSISFEKATEEQLYLYELLGIPKPKESLAGLIKSRSILQTNYGTVTVYFGKPMSLRKYCYSKINSMEYVNIPRCERHLRIFGRGAQEMKIAKYFGLKIVQMQQDKMAIYPRSVLSSLILGSEDTCFQLDALAGTISYIGILIHQLGGNLYGFEEIKKKNGILKTIKYSDLVLKLDGSDCVTFCCSSFNESVKKMDLSKISQDTDFVCGSLGYIYLSCQRNKLMHTCLLSAMLVLSASSTTILKDCSGHFHFLSQLFDVEFIFDPDTTINEKFNNTVTKLEELGIISIHNEIITISEERSIDSNFLSSLLQPFIDAYMIVILVLLSNTYDFPSTFKSMANILQVQAASIIKASRMKTYEALSLHTLSNIITSFCKKKHLLTVKNEKFETLVNGMSLGLLNESKACLSEFVSPNIRLYMRNSKL